MAGSPPRSRVLQRWPIALRLTRLPDPVREQVELEWAMERIARLCIRAHEGAFGGWDEDGVRDRRAGEG